MTAKWIELIVGPLEQKKQYRSAKSRIEALPDPYRRVAEAFLRYLMYYGGTVEGDIIVRMYVDGADLWERAALDGTPIRDIVGDDPVDFAETFAQAYGGKQWIDKERARFVEAVDPAAAEDRS
jgi:DNA-binding ferritin-like protein (Dps family)